MKDPKKKRIKHLGLGLGIGSAKYDACTLVLRCPSSSFILFSQ